ncbi:PREDICTED: sucrase-isomaltase, intestinal-like [Branchiostoma belcheri]|uniref:alpha-glucosidase n=1 Tax=Branchiostoma belcheri TaxID=7741 RepID=A0A6P4YCB2_BRABE|nr:PREDICTED: sucrase-isomaltase, intestinal-like [Branchiostoma belcheri]
MYQKQDDYDEFGEETIMHTEYRPRRKKNRRPLLLCFCVVAVLLAIIIPVAVVTSNRRHGASGPSPECPSGDERERVDCYPEGGASLSRCEARGCCWDQPATQGPPSCFYPTNHGYELSGGLQRTPLGYMASLHRLNTPSAYGNDREIIEVEVEIQQDYRLHLKLSDPKHPGYEVPEAAVKRPLATTLAEHPLFNLTFTSKPFSIKVTRKSTGATIFDSSVGKLTLSAQFLSVSTRLASSNLYGLGEHVHRSYRHDLNWKTWPFFTRDSSPAAGDSANLYGQHPFYMCVEEDGSANGVFVLNSNAMDVTLQPGAPDSAPIVTYRVIGGVLDFYMFLGPSPENVVQQYTEVIGRPMMPAYWGLGFQLSKWFYKNSRGLREVILRTRATGIPYDVQYSDIDYMEDRKDFTYDGNNYGDLPDVIRDLHNNGQKYIVILDPAVSTQKRRDGSPYVPYEMGRSAGVFVNTSDGKTPIVGQVWPSDSVFPDFTNPSGVQWWADNCRDLHNNISFDGLWIDMNEPSNFLNGSLSGCATNTRNHPPYLPDIKGSLLYEGTLCMDAKQMWGDHYDVHSLYGHSMAIATRNAMRSILPSKRGVVLTRSSFAGTGQFASHWLGDNKAAWEDMAWSIPGILEFGLFGIPHVGADICGFGGNTTEELCQRWMQLGAFYPFSRNHNTMDGNPQDPAVFSQAMIDSTRDVMMTRYTLLPYLYTLFYHAHVTGATVVRPLLHEFPADRKTWDVDRQFLWGRGLLISPVLTQGDTQVDAYFPDDRWFDFFTGAEVEGQYRGQTVTLDAPLNKINVHVRGGTILPTQQPANTTVYSRRNPMGLVVALNDSDSAGASGSLFWDDGESYDSIEKSNFLQVTFTASASDGIRCTVDALPVPVPSPPHWALLPYDKVDVLGLDLPDVPTVKAGRPGDLRDVDSGNVQYDRDNKVLRLANLVDMNLWVYSDLQITWT